jgi:hypothetical protein
VPFIATRIKAPNIENVWTTSVHTTAFKPPTKINIKFINESVDSKHSESYQLSYRKRIWSQRPTLLYEHRHLWLD